MAVELEVGSGALVVRFRGWDAVWAFRRRVQVPLDHVVGAHVGERAVEVRTLGFRLVGSYIPRVLVAGLFRSRGGGRQLWSVHRSAQVVVVDLRDERWDRIVVQVPDAHAAASSIEAARGG